MADKLADNLKWFIGIFGIVILSSIWHVSGISTKVSAMEEESKDKVDVKVFYVMTEAITKQMEMQSIYFKKALETHEEFRQDQKKLNNELVKNNTYLKQYIENMQTCDENGK